MKKTFISLFSAAIAVVTMSSCLGDGGDQSYAGTREFGVVGVSSEGLKQAFMLGNNVITGGDIDKYSSGDIILATYKISSANYINSTTVKVDYANVDDQNDAYVSSSQASVTADAYDLVADENNSFTTLGAQYGYSTEYFMNRWLLSVSAIVKKDEAITGVYLHYNENKQTQLDGSALPEDAIVLDVELRKTKPNTGTTETKTDTKSVGVDLSTLRRWDLKNMKNQSSTKTLYIWLRYPKYTSSTKTYAPAILQNALGITYLSSSN